jgi:hypothetical protein
MANAEIMKLKSSGILSVLEYRGWRFPLLDRMIDTLPSALSEAVFGACHEGLCLRLPVLLLDSPIPLVQGAISHMLQNINSCSHLESSKLHPYSLHRSTHQ